MLVVPWEAHPRPQPPTLTRHQFKIPAVRLRHALNDGQTQPGTRRTASRAIFAAAEGLL